MSDQPRSQFLTFIVSSFKINLIYYSVIEKEVSELVLLEFKFECVTQPRSIVSFSKKSVILVIETFAFEIYFFH